jgi:glycogen debranching enzyme
MDGACLTSKEELPPPTGKGPTRPCVVIPHNGSVPHALFYDLTHDNESYLHKRTAEDALSTGALMTFCYSAIGSVKGFDDLYPKLLNLVQESRKYEVTALGEASGIAKVKRILNSLHAEMAIGKFEEGHVHEEHGVSPRYHISFLLSHPFLVHNSSSRSTSDSEGLSTCRSHGVP